MTEAAWLESADPVPMLKLLRGKASHRKLRLFAVACCRLIWHLLVDRRSRSALEQAELLAERETSPSEWEQLGRDAGRAEFALHRAADLQRAWAASAVNVMVDYYGSREDLLVLAGNTSFRTAAAVGEVNGPAFRVECCTHARVVRCTFGNPFRPWPPLPPAVLAWNDRTVPRLAHALYDERLMPQGTLDAGRLAILADALLDAGADDEALLAHLRSEGPHVRGCFAIDLILGKS